MHPSFPVLLPALLVLCAACAEPTPAGLRFKTQLTNGYWLEGPLKRWPSSRARECPARARTRQ